MNIAVPKLHPGAVHVWRMDLDRCGFGGALSEDERARASSFKFARDLRRYEGGRSSLRFLLGGYLGVDPGRIVFSYSPSGKPSLAGGELAFNVAHSGPHGLVAVARAGQIGVDIEEVRTMPDLADVARSAFSRDEFARWQGLPPDQQAGAFYRCWTRKEAYLKATGEGIAHRLQRFSVAFEPDEVPRILMGAEGEWTLEDISVGPGVIAALACEGPSPKVEHFSLAAV